MSDLLDAELPEIDLDLSGLDLAALDMAADSEGASAAVCASEPQQAETVPESVCASEPQQAETVPESVCANEPQQAETVLEETAETALALPYADEGGEAAYAAAEYGTEAEPWPAETAAEAFPYEEAPSEEEMWEPASSAWTEEVSNESAQAGGFQYDYRAAALMHANMIESSLDGLPEDSVADAFEGHGRRGASIEITAATEEDVEDIIELAASLAPCSMSPFRPVPEERVEEDRRADMQSVYKLINNDDFGAFVARDARGKYIGHVLVKSGLNDFLTGETQAWVFDIAVQPKYWGSGVSKRLLSAAEYFARERGIKYLGLTVTAANARALRFYQRAGYKEERYQMVKILPPLDGD